LYSLCSPAALPCRDYIASLIIFVESLNYSFSFLYWVKLRIPYPSKKPNLHFPSRLSKQPSTALQTKWQTAVPVPHPAQPQAAMHPSLTISTVVKSFAFVPIRLAPLAARSCLKRRASRSKTLQRSRGNTTTRRHSRWRSMQRRNIRKGNIKKRNI